MWQKDKLLIMSNSSFCHNVFKIICCSRIRKCLDVVKGSNKINKLLDSFIWAQCPIKDWKTRGELYLEIDFINKLKHFFFFVFVKKIPLPYTFRGEYSKQCVRISTIPLLISQIDCLVFCH